MRSGTGGEEAALWAADLVRMYQKYADSQGWKVAWLNESLAESGGFKEAVIQVGALLCTYRRWAHSFVLSTGVKSAFSS